jgi:hypothetical protein
VTRDAVARMRALMAEGEQLGEEGLAVIVASLPTRQREVFALMVESFLAGNAPDAHDVARKLGVHYTSAKRTIDRIYGALPKLVVEYHNIRKSRGNKT